MAVDLLDVLCCPAMQNEQQFEKMQWMPSLVSCFYLTVLLLCELAVGWEIGKWPNWGKFIYYLRKENNRAQLCYRKVSDQIRWALVCVDSRHKSPIRSISVPGCNTTKCRKGQSVKRVVNTYAKSSILIECSVFRWSATAFSNSTTAQTAS